MLTATDVILAMNRAGEAGRPFLFGFDFELTRGFFIPDPLRQSRVRFNIRGITNAPDDSADTPYMFERFPEPEAVYARRFDIIRAGLLRGDSFLTNLTVRTPIRTDLAPDAIYHRARALYKIYYPDAFVCFSPERFVRIDADGTIASNPMKGTIDARLPDARERILADPKETAEHNTIVDLIRNDLSMVADQVHVQRFRYIDRLETSAGPILQVSSEIAGQLPDDWRSRMGHIIARLLPAGSISGAPKDATVRLIRQAEGAPRGFYTGIFGLFDGQALDSAVFIRFLDLTTTPLTYQSGGGITARSRMHDEYEEVIQKVYLPF
ncbi:aminodeoxychorismate synthase component I [Tannerella sp. oral taxon 808]|nr:aminodeoxychorismate synthase component I [Tannerella sp. oral taxon 808]